MNVRKYLYLVFAMLGLTVAVGTQSHCTEQKTHTSEMKLADIPIHDPWILAHQESKTYYLYTSARPSATGEGRCGVMTYKSKDLEN